LAVRLVGGPLVGSALVCRETRQSAFGCVKMAAEVPGNDSAFLVSNGSAGGNGSALKGAMGVRMATELPGNVSASWRSLGV
jgi:hypothetical protein